MAGRGSESVAERHPAARQDSPGSQAMDTCGDCCAAPTAMPEPPSCPLSGCPGERVPWRTVAALTTVPLPPKQDFFLCRDPQCELVYFGEAGARLSLSDLRVVPGFKHGGDLLCYCFSFRRQELETEVATLGATSIPERIAAKVKAGGCACEVRHPRGKCCLGEVTTFARSLLGADSSRRR